MTQISKAFRQPPLIAAMYADLLPKPVRERVKDFFVYGVDFLPLAASGTARQTIQIQNDSDFFVVAGVATSRDTATAAIVADRSFTVEIVSSGSGRQLFNRAQDFDNIFGTAQLPSYWPYPKLLERGSEIATTLVNLTANARNVRVAYWGFKVFKWNVERSQISQPAGV